ncbi:hypothetical protein Tco_1040497, partial [Tanacetum coccineum]
RGVTVVESFDWDEESLSSDDEGVLGSKHLWLLLRMSHLWERVMLDQVQRIENKQKRYKVAGQSEGDTSPKRVIRGMRLQLSVQGSGRGNDWQ